MPKKAAAGAGDATAKASPKAEKAAAPAVDDKKPKAQPKQEDKAQNTKGQAQDKPQGKGKGKQQEPEPVVEAVPVQGKPERQYEPDDEVEKEIKARIAGLEEELQGHKDEITQIGNDITGKKESQTTLKNEQTKALEEAQKVGDAKGINEEYDKLIGNIHNLQDLQRAKRDEQRALKQQLGGGARAEQKDYMKQLEAEIKGLQDRQASGDVSKLLDEKKLISEIGRLNNTKKLYKQYLELNESISQYESQITTLLPELEKLKQKRKEYREERKVYDDQITKSRGQQKANSADIDKSIQRRKELNDIVTALRTRIDGCYDQLRDYRSGKREKAKKERQDERDKRQEERRQQELKRKKEEEERGCYADELEACTQLLQYLEPFKYCPPEVATEEPGEKAEKEEKEGEDGEKEKEEKEAPAPTTPPPSKRGGKKKQTGETDKEKELKHGAQTFFQFETLSLVAPQKVGDVEASLAEISEKKEFFTKREAEKKEKRKTNGN